MADRCRLCTANDEDALIEELAAALWRNEADGRSLDQAGPRWQAIMRGFAQRTVETLRRDHA